MGEIDYLAQNSCKRGDYEDWARFRENGVVCLATIRSAPPVDGVVGKKNRKKGQVVGICSQQQPRLL